MDPTEAVTASVRVGVGCRGEAVRAGIGGPDTGEAGITEQDNAPEAGEDLEAAGGVGGGDVATAGVAVGEIGKVAGVLAAVIGRWGLFGGFEIG